MSEANKALARRFVSAINARDLSILDAIYAPDYQHHDPSLPPELQRGLPAYKQLCTMFTSAFPDLRGTVYQMLAEGDKVAVRMTWSGTHKGELMGVPPTGKRAEFAEMSILRIAGGKIVEGWVSFDALGMMQQLGIGAQQPAA